MAINLYSKASVDSLLTAKLSISSLSNAAATTLNATAPTTDQVLSFDGTELKWATVSGGVGLTISTLSNGATSTLDSTVPTTGQALTFDGTNLKWSTIGGGGTWMGSRISIYGGYLYDEDSATYVTGLTLQGTGTINAQNLTLQASGGGVLTFADATTQSTAAIGIPSGGATNQVLSKINSTDYNVQWSTPATGGCDVQTFGTSSTSGTFTWTKPAGAKVVEVYLVGAGAGGGSGARQATTSIRSGGAGGGGGGVVLCRVSAATLGSTETVTIGAKGTGGASVTSDSTNGNAGTNGGNSTFSIFKAYGGNLGAGGNNTGASTGGTAHPNITYFVRDTFMGGAANGNTANGFNASASPSPYLQPGGGGGGAGAVASSVVNRSGGAGGGFTATQNGNNYAIAGGSGGTSAGVSATAGTSATTNNFQAGTGGGAGYYITASGNGTNNAGAAGGWPGGGGGGGGATDNTYASGKGGDGAHGFACIVTWY